MPKGSELRCPTCGAAPVLQDSAEIYGGRSYGLIWRCPNCPDHYVGCHGDSDRPKGTLAGPEVRELRKAAHAQFDRLWKGHGKVRRRQCYAWLAQAMNISEEEAHIAMMQEGQLLQVIDLLQQRGDEIGA